MTEITVGKGARRDYKLQDCNDWCSVSAGVAGGTV